MNQVEAAAAAVAVGAASLGLVQGGREEHAIDTTDCTCCLRDEDEDSVDDVDAECLSFLDPSAPVPAPPGNTSLPPDDRVRLPPLLRVPVSASSSVSDLTNGSTLEDAEPLPGGLRRTVPLPAECPAPSPRWWWCCGYVGVWSCGPRAPATAAEVRPSSSLGCRWLPLSPATSAAAAGGAVAWAGEKRWRSLGGECRRRSLGDSRCCSRSSSRSRGDSRYTSAAAIVAAAAAAGGSTRSVVVRPGVGGGGG